MRLYIDKTCMQEKSIQNKTINLIFVDLALQKDTRIGDQTQNKSRPRKQSPITSSIYSIFCKPWYLFFFPETGPG